MIKGANTDNYCDESTDCKFADNIFLIKELSQHLNSQFLSFLSTSNCIEKLLINYRIQLNFCPKVWSQSYNIFCNRILKNNQGSLEASRITIGGPQNL